VVFGRAPDGNMQRRTKLSITVAVPIFFILSAGCASQPVVSKVFFENEDRLIRLDVVYRTGGQEHSHPVKLNETELANALRSISARPLRGLPSFLIGQKGFRFPAALSEGMIQFLASQGADALRQATPLEEVVFYFNQPRKEGPIREITSGGLYMQGNRMHLVLANYRHGAVGSMEIERARENPLTVLGEPLYELLPDSHGRIEEPNFWASLYMDPPQHISVDYSAEAKSAQGSAKEKRASQDINIKSPPGLTMPEKLRELDSLRQEGLITEDQFQKKRKQLLDSY